MTVAEQSNLYRLIGVKIRRLRLDASFSQEELGAEVNLSRSSVVNIEKGRQHPPLHVIWNFADALDVDPADLIPARHEIRSPTNINRELEREVSSALEDGDEEAVRQIAEFIQASRSGD